MEDHSIDSQRLSHLETEVASIKTTVYSQNKKLEGIEKGLDKISDKVAAKSTDWKTLAAWASLILGLTIYHGNLTLKPINSSINTLDSTLQRDMRLLDEINAVKLESIYKDVKRNTETLSKCNIK
jgi:hypothetical protein